MRCRHVTLFKTEKILSLLTCLKWLKRFFRIHNTLLILCMYRSKFFMVSIVLSFWGICSSFLRLLQSEDFLKLTNFEIFQNSENSRLSKISVSENVWFIFSQNIQISEDSQNLGKFEKTFIFWKFRSELTKKPVLLFQLVNFRQCSNSYRSQTAETWL